MSASARTPTVEEQLEQEGLKIKEGHAEKDVNKYISLLISYILKIPSGSIKAETPRILGQYVIPVFAKLTNEERMMVSNEIGHILNPPKRGGRRKTRRARRSRNHRRQSRRHRH